MKTRIIISIATILLTVSAYSQDSTRFTIQKGVPICSDTANLMLTRVWLPKPIVVYIIDYMDQNRYYPIEYENATYYIYNGYMKDGLPTAAKASSGSIMTYYVELYGRPDDISDYSSGDYISKTYTWHCAAGKYRSIDFVLNNGKWKKDSEYASDCIR